MRSECAATPTVLPKLDGPCRETDADLFFAHHNSHDRAVSWPAAGQSGGSHEHRDFLEPQRVCA